MSVHYVFLSVLYLFSNQLKLVTTSVSISQSVEVCSAYWTSTALFYWHI